MHCMKQHRKKRESQSHKDEATLSWPTTEDMFQTFLSMLEEWKMSEDGVVLVLRHRGATIVKGTRLTVFPDLSCTAHTVQHATNDGLLSQRAVANVTATLKRCTIYFHHSIMVKRGLRNS